MGGLMLLLWIIRWSFRLYESPKYLMGRGRDAEAIEVLNKVAVYNGSSNRLTLEQLQKVGLIAGTESGAEKGSGVDASVAAAIRRNMEHLKGDHVKSLFATRKLALSTSLLIIIWALIGLAFPLYNSFVTYFLLTRGADFGDSSVYITYRNVSLPIPSSVDLQLTRHSPSIASHSVRNRRPRCIARRMDGGTSSPWP